MTPVLAIPESLPPAPIPCVRVFRQHCVPTNHHDRGVANETNRAERCFGEALATELVCVLRYKRHYFMAAGILAAPVAAEFLEHAIEEMSHADRRAATPNMSRATRSGA